MCVDIKLGVRTAAAVAWEAAAKYHRWYWRYLCSIEVVAAACIAATMSVAAACTCCCCCWCCCCVRCSSTRRWWSTGSHPTESLVEQNCVSSGYWLCVSHGPKVAIPRNPDRKTNEKPTINVRQRMHMHHLVRDNTWAGRSNPRVGPRNCRAGPYRPCVSWASLPCYGPGRAETFEKRMGRAGP